MKRCPYLAAFLTYSKTLVENRQFSPSPAAFCTPVGGNPIRISLTSTAHYSRSSQNNIIPRDCFNAFLEWRYPTLWRNFRLQAQFFWCSRQKQTV